MNTIRGTIGSWLGAFMVCGLVACGDDTGEQGNEIPGSATPVGDSGVYVDGGEPAALPESSPDEDAPVIESIHAAQTSNNQFSLYIEVTALAPIETVFLDFGEHGVFAVAAQPVSFVVPDACSILESTQGYGCTDECVAACECLSCGDGTTEEASKGACATACSIARNEGNLTQAPYAGSEAVFADVIYNGYEDQPGVIAGTACQASACEAAATSASTVVEVGFYYQDFPDLVPLGAAVVQTAPTPERPSLTSGSMSPGRLSVEPCHHGECQ